MPAKRKRRVTRADNSIKARFQRYLSSFTPSGFKRYWLNAEGARRAGKIAGFGVLTMFLVFLYFAKDLPSPSKINARVGSQNTQFYASDGKTLIYEVHGDKNRRVISFADMPKNMKNATIAIEDKDFYHHGAFSAIGILRSAFVDVTHRTTSQGGSTITQQYVKNALLDPTDHTFTRKVKELILSLEIESLYKKDDILKLYLNEIPFGSQAYGIESACQTFFPQDTIKDKCAPNLTLSQSTMLAAVLNAPSYYSPYNTTNRQALIERQHLVLDRMVRQKLVSPGEANGARLSAPTFKDQVGLSPLPQVRTAVNPYPHFSQYAVDYLENKYGANAVENGGLKVITSLDINKQKMAQAAIDRGIKNVRALGGSNVSLVSADPKSGHVQVMIGSYNPNDPEFGAFNVALANRQPGSSFKPFVYATAIGMNKDGCGSAAYCPTWGAGSTVYDVPTDFGGGYKPKNYSGTNYGVQSVRTALDGSLNIPAVKMLYIAGVANSIKTAHSMGISTLNQNPSDYGLSLVLGSGEVKLNDMVNAYESFANGGVHYASTPIMKVTDPHNKVLEDTTTKPAQPKRVLDPQVAFSIANILSDNQARSYIFGANNPLHINGRTVAAKTGTTENYNDAWTMGFSPDLVTGVWAGNNNNAPMSTEAADIAAPIWHDYMAGGFRATIDGQSQIVPGALADYPASNTFDKPAGIKTVTIDANTGKAPSAGTRQTRTDIFPSWYKVGNTAGTTTKNIDKVSGKLATSCTPAAAIESRTSSTVAAEIPSSDPSYVRWEPPVAALAARLGYSGGGSLPTDNDDIHHCEDTKPSVNVSASNNSDGTISITSKVTSGTYPANSLVVTYDDQTISTQSINGSTTYKFDYTPTSNGSHTIKATVTDAALYSGADETTITVSTINGSTTSGPPSALKITPGNGTTLQSGHEYTMSWSPGGGGPFTITITRVGGPSQPPYATGNTPNRTYTPSSTGSFTWQVTGADGTSASKAFTVI